MPTHYDTLKVAQNASIEDINKSYKKLSLKYHPDLVKRTLTMTNSNVSDEEVQSAIVDATKKFQELGQAYTTLSDSQLRRRYDLNQPDSDPESQRQYDDVHSWSTAQKDAYVSSIFTPELCKKLDKCDEQEEFLKACCDGNLARVTSFLNDPDIDPNGTRHSAPGFDDTCQVRSIPLQEAVIRKHHAIIVLLLAHPKIRAETVEQHHISYGSQRRGRWGIGRMEHIPDTRTPLKIATKKNNVEIVILILRHYIMQMASNKCSVDRLFKPPRHRKSTLLHELAKYRSEFWAQLQIVGREQGHDWYLEILTKILDSEGKVPAQQHPLHLVLTTRPLKLSFFTLSDVMSQIQTEVSALQQPRPS